MQGIKAIASTVYFAIVIIAFIIYGDKAVQALAIAASFSAGVSQLVLQGSERKHEVAGQLCIGMALACAIMAMVLFIR